MYERLSTKAEKTIKLAGAIARKYEQEWVGTEHILLAISKEGNGLGAQILDRRGATLDVIKAKVDDLVRQSLEETWVFGRLPGTPHFKNVVARAIEAAQNLKSSEVCTEHILIGLLKEEGSVAYNTLQELGIHIADVQKDILAAAT